MSDSILELFLASTVHELKNHLGGITDSVESLGESVQGCDQIDLIKSQLQVIALKLNQVLLNYINNKKGYQLHLEEVFVEDFIEDLLQRHQLSAQIHRIKLQCKTESTDLVLYCDKNLISNVVDTAVFNALSTDASEIFVEVKKQKPYIAVHIEDNGPGFPEDLIAKPLEEIRPTQLKENKTGLGLFFATQIAQAHENCSHAGKLELSNHRTLNGACVSLYLP